MSTYQESLFADADFPQPEPWSVYIEEIDLDSYVGPQPSRRLLDSIDLYGVLQPVMLQKKRNERFRIIDGGRRIRAALACGQEEISAVVFDNGVDLSFVTAAANRLRSNNLLSDYCTIKHMLDQGATFADIYAMSGLSKAQARRILVLGNLDSRLFTVYSRGGMSDNAAIRIAKLPQEKQEELVGKIKNDKLSMADVKQVMSARRQEQAQQFMNILDEPEAPEPRGPSTADLFGQLIEEAAKAGVDPDLIARCRLALTTGAIR